MPNTAVKTSVREILHQNQLRSKVRHFSQTVVILHNIRSMHNVGSVFRSCDGFGIQELVLSGYTPTPPRAEISKTALGAEETVHWTHQQDFSLTATRLKQQGYTIIGFEQTNQSILLNEYPFDAAAKVALVFGNEVTGIDQDVLDQMDQLIEIAQFGVKHSFNVSVSVGIALFGFFNAYAKQGS